MKFVFLLGGAVGFVTGLGTSALLDHAADRVLLDGAVGCLGGAMLFRWYWGVVLNGLRDTVAARQRAALAAATSAPAAPASKTK